MTQTLDARQRRSRAALFQALDALLEDQPYASISVSDLADRAGVGRQTFYRHFADIDALLGERLREDLADQLALARSTPDDGTPERSVALATFAFERVAAQPHLYRIILSGDAGSATLGLLRAQVGELLAIDAPRAEPTGYVDSFVAGAILGMMLRWLERGLVPSAGEMGRLFVSFAMGEGARPSP